MEKTKIITCALISTLLIASFWASFYPQRAYAQGAFQLITSFKEPIKAMHYQAETDSVWVLSEGSGFTWLYQVSRSTGAIMLEVNQTSRITNGVSQDIWCGKTDCYISSSVSGGAGVIYRIPTQDISPNIFKGVNVTGTVSNPTGGAIYHLTGRDAVTGGFGSVTIWADACDNAGCAVANIRIFDGISMLFAGELPQVDSGATIRVHELVWSGIAGVSDNLLITVDGGITPSIAANELHIYDLSSQLVVCNIQLPVITAQVALGLGLTVRFTTAGASDHKIYVSANSGHVFVYNDSCTLLQTITNTQTGLSTNVRFIEYSSGRVFMQEDGVNAKISQMLINSTGHIQTSANNIYFPFPSVAQPTFDSVFTTVNLHNMVLFGGFAKLWFPYSDSEKEIGILTYDVIEEPPAGNGNSVNGRCGVGTVLDCIGDRSVSTAITGGQDIAQVSGNLFCGLGLNATCSGDAKDNGTGLLLMLITGTFFAGAVLSTIAIANTKFGAGISYTEIPKEFWLFLVVGVVAFAFYQQWITDLIFYGLMVGLAGLFSFGLYKHLRGG